MEQLQSVPEEIISKITDIIVIGGMNDRFAITEYGLDDSTIYAAIKDFSDYVTQHFDDAKIHLFMVGVSRLRNPNIQLISVKQKWLHASVLENVIYHENADLAGKNYQNFTNVNHPNAEGFKLLANGIVNGLKSGRCEYTFNRSLSCVLENHPQSGGTLNTGASVVSNRFTGGVRVALPGALTFTFNDVQEKTGNILNWSIPIGICSWDKYFASPVNSQYLLTPCRIKLEDNTFIFADFAYLHFEDENSLTILKPMITKLNQGTLRIKELSFLVNSFLFAPTEV